MGIVERKKEKERIILYTTASSQSIINGLYSLISNQNHPKWWGLFSLMYAGEGYGAWFWFSVRVHPSTFRVLKRAFWPFEQIRDGHGLIWKLKVSRQRLMEVVRKVRKMRIVLLSIMYTSSERFLRAGSRSFFWKPGLYIIFLRLERLFLHAVISRYTARHTAGCTITETSFLMFLLLKRRCNRSAE